MAAFLLGMGGNSVRADEKIRELAVFLPENINTVSIVRFQASSSSDNKANGKWNRMLREHFGDERSGFLGWGNTLLVGSLFHPSVPEEAWATGVMHLPENINLKAIAIELDATIDSLAGQPVLITPRGNIVATLPSNVIGIYRPGLRQDAANWIKSATKKSSITIKPYLQETLDKPGDFVLALNLENLLAPKFVKSIIEKDERFARHQNLVDKMVPLVAGLRGVTLSATTKETTTECLVTLDFSSEVGSLVSVVKTLFLSILEDTGAMIEEFPKAKVTASGNSVKLRCQLSEGSLHRLLSLVASPCVSAESHSHAMQSNQNDQSLKNENKAKKAGPSEKQRATKRYFEAVSKKIDNLQKANRNAKNYKNTIAWHENFARNIENLSSKNVEREFLVFGQRTAKRFRALASSLRGQEVKVNLQKKTLTYKTDYDPGWASVNWWGGYGYRAPTVKVDSNLQQVREKIAREELIGYENRQKIWDLILEDQQEMKSRLDSVK